MNATNWLTAEEESELIDAATDLMLDLALKYEWGDLELGPETIALIEALDRLVFARNKRMAAQRTGEWEAELP